PLQRRRHRTRDLHRQADLESHRRQRLEDHGADRSRRRGVDERRAQEPGAAHQRPRRRVAARGRGGDEGRRRRPRDRLGSAGQVMSATFTSTYSRTPPAKYVSDKMRNVLKYLISYYNLSPVALLDAWTDWVDAGARELLERGDLEKIVIEFYKP